MFERFTRGARVAVVDAQAHAREARAPQIGPEHLLLALRGRAGDSYLAERVPDVPELSAEFDRIRRNAGIGPTDAEALAGLGIDVDRVVEAVERVHGENALGRPRRPWRKGHLPFDRDAKRTMERTLTEAVSLGHRTLREEHILLALLGMGGNVADVLAAHDVTYAGVRQMLMSGGKS